MSLEYEGDGHQGWYTARGCGQSAENTAGPDGPRLQRPPGGPGGSEEVRSPHEARSGDDGIPRQIQRCKHTLYMNCIAHYISYSNTDTDMLI